MYNRTCIWLQKHTLLDRFRAKCRLRTRRGKITAAHFKNYKFITALTIKITTYRNIPDAKQHFCHSYQTRKKISFGNQKNGPLLLRRKG